ncbi:hypothetical protein [Croceicoccus gelatinilyticus]|uniref:hypothetical protein n=1 Tax=Croceicoccus gelatinilyticus TaxID=2835536 RepID=UPI001BD09BE7|nr:hypothetical protein [Croceicoccus gelatinilyticus]MBS7671607.1 hypothetical protein [Croceicoccus gelatinilyticus]
MAFTPVCSLRPRAQTATTGRTHQHWARDPYHIRRTGDASRTRCGIDCSDWLVMDEMEEPNEHCCYRCLSITDPAKQ